MATKSPEVRSRLDILKSLLSEGQLSTQDELREKLEKLSFPVNQSTISRDLRKLGAIKVINHEGQTTYRLAEDTLIAPPTAPTAPTMDALITNIQSNGSIVVIRTTPGSASLIARHLDLRRPEGILGTIAGDDTIFVAPRSVKQIPATIRSIRESFATSQENIS